MKIGQVSYVVRGMWDFSWIMESMGVAVSEMTDIRPVSARNSVNVRLGSKAMQAPVDSTNICFQPAVRYFASGSAGMRLSICTARML